MFCCCAAPADSGVIYGESWEPSRCSTAAGEPQNIAPAQCEPTPILAASTEQPMLLGAMPVTSGKAALPDSECVLGGSIVPTENKASARDSAETPEPPRISGFVLSFETVAGPRDVVASQRPLGLTFHRKCPVVIESVAGHAHDLRIQEGWTLTHFDGLPVQDDFEEFHMKFTQKVAQRLPGPALLPLLFQTEASWDSHGYKSFPALHTVVASSKPMGLTFFKRIPVEVKAVAGHCKALGVQPRWTLVSFGETQTAEFAKFEEFINKFQQSAATLTPGPGHVPCIVQPSSSIWPSQA